jgi:hypothetical protein
MNKIFSFQLEGLVLSIFLLVSWTANQTFGQKVLTVGDDAIPPPHAEKFVESNDLVVPWRNTGCQGHYMFVDPDCHMITVVESTNAHRLSLYSSDSSLWWRFSVSLKEPDYFFKNVKIGFIPFSTFWLEKEPDGFVLRLAGESPNWYEVEVNEKTRATKFVLKKDPLWAKISWGYWLLVDPRIYINTERTKFYDKPNGSIIDDMASYDSSVLVFQKDDGDWALVRVFRAGKAYEVWIRWREGRDILVGCTFNHFKIP